MNQHTLTNEQAHNFQELAELIRHLWDADSVPLPVELETDIGVVYFAAKCFIANAPFHLPSVDTIELPISHPGIREQVSQIHHDYSRWCIQEGFEAPDQVGISVLAAAMSWWLNIHGLDQAALGGIQ